MKIFSLLCLLSLFMTPFVTRSQISTENATPLQLSNDLVSSWGISDPAANVRINGSELSNTPHPRAGLLLAQNSAFYFQQSLILATKNIHIAHCEPESEGVTETEVALDMDMVLLVGNSELHNLTTLEFDFVANTDSISFEFLFASREYSDDLCNAHDDVVGIFLSGPGINGPYTNNAENLATTVDHFNLVSVLSVNNGQSDPMNTSVSSGITCYLPPDSTACPCLPQFFTDNGSGNGTGLHSELCFGGYTVPILASSHFMIGETYTLKLAVANINADEKDSALIISLNNTSVGFADASKSEMPFTLYPNPNLAGEVSVSFELTQSTSAEISVTNSLGQHLYSNAHGLLQPGEYRFTLPTNTPAPGIYLVHLKTSTGIATRKLVVQ